MKRVHDDDDASDRQLVAMTNTFRIQVDEFMKERQLNKQDHTKLQRMVSSVEKALSDSAVKHSFDYHETAFWESQNISFPLSGLSEIIGRTSSTQSEYRFTPPAQITHLHQSTNSSVMDVDVVLPDALFGKRDFVNLVYATKRAHYMCSCITLIRKGHPGVKIQFMQDYHRDSLFPNLFVSEDFSSKIGLVIHFHASKTALASLSRFAPSMGNLRPSSVHPEYNVQDEVPTPNFNQKILRNLLKYSLYERVNNCVKNKHTLVSALSLTLSWAECRGHSEQLSIFFHGYFLYLVEKQVIVDQQDTLTVLRNFYQAIVTFDFDSVNGFNTEALDQQVLDDYKKAFPLVFLDESGYWNILHRVALNSFKRLQREMSRSLILLGNSTSFDGLFLTESSFDDSLDHYIRLSLKADTLNNLRIRFPLDSVDKNDIVAHLLVDLEKNLVMAMGERFEYYDYKFLDISPSAWKCSADMFTFSNVDILFGFRVSTQWSNPLTVGPVANLPEAKEFRQFWHNKSQLRKFADSRVCECVVWAGENSSAVPSNIMQFVLEKKYNVPQSSVSWRSQLPAKLGSDKVVQESISKSFSALSSILRSLRNLPLEITNIYGVSPYIRGAEPDAVNVFGCNSGGLCDGHRIPSPHKFSKYTPSLTVFLKLEYSVKWGADAEGIRQLTSSFYIQIAEQLKTAHSLVAEPTADQLFVVKDKITFRLVIVHDKIRFLLSKQVDQLKLNGSSRVESTPLGRKLADFNKRYVAELAVQSSLLTISVKHSIYGGTVQLLKRWLSAHLLANAIPDLVLELIVTYCLDQSAADTPRTTWAAFRRVLSLLAQHNWLSTPLIVDLNNEWKDDDLLKLQESFIKLRPVLPVMVVITNEDQTGSKWTRDAPSPILLKRIVALAATTINVLNENLMSDSPINLITSLTTTNFSVYDAVIHLHTRAITRNYKLDNDSAIKGLPIVDFDPIDELVYALNSSYHEVALFFYDKYGGDRIGIRFKPQERTVPAKISRSALHTFKDRNSLVLNKDEIYEGIKMLGSGIVKEVVIL